MSPTLPEKVSSPRIQAAGVVALRGVGNQREALVIHRPDRNDWSLPKGKLDPGERLAACAVRETFEETGLRVTLGVPLQTVRYRVVDPKSKSPIAAKKSVHYWLARIVDQSVASGDQDIPDGWVPNSEVGEMRWVRVKKLPGVLTYPHDLDVVMEAMLAPSHTTPLVILRHAQAEKRQEFRERAGEAPDQLRPLTQQGEMQADALRDALSAYGLQAVHASSAVRCMDTVRPFAEAHGIEINAMPDITEEAFAEHPKRGTREVLGLLTDPRAAVVSIHRPTKKRLMRAIGYEIEQEVSLALEPAEYIVLHRPAKFDAAGNATKVRLGSGTHVEIGSLTLD